MSAGVGVADGKSLAAVTVARQWRRDRRFYTGMGLVCALAVFAGFAPTYYLRSFSGRPALAPLLHLHGLIFTSWIVLFVVQTTLVAAKRTDLHKRLGIAGGLLTVLMVGAGFAAAVDSVRRGFTPPGGPPPLVFFVIPIADLIVFSTLVGTSLYFRRRSAIHKRLMLLATISLLTPAIARMSIVAPGGLLAFFGLTDVVVIACMAYDRIATGRVHPAFWWGGLFVIASLPLRLAVAGTSAWLAFATWVTR